MNLKSYIPFYKRNLSLAFPVMITQAGQMIVQFADNIMVGHLGTSQFAGVGFANMVFTVGFVFCTCFTQGMIPHIGQSYGKGEHKKVAEFFANGIAFDAIYTGYLGNTRQIAYIKEIFATMGKPGCVRFVDPVMADSGKLYPGLDGDYVSAMRELCSIADVILPNITEACLLTDTEYRETYDRAYVEEMAGKLSALGPKTVIITGVGFTPGNTGVFVLENNQPYYYEHDRIETLCHGTGDVFASCFVGAKMKGLPSVQAAEIAAEFTFQSIVNTYGDKNHWYGVKFEPMLKDLTLRLN